MRKRRFIVMLALVVVLLTILACSNPTSHNEESGTQYGIGDTCYEVKNGLRLIIAYEDSTDSFVGTVENVSSELIADVRVEIHLDSGTELGPTTYTDLEPEQITNIILEVNGEAFVTWEVHAESGTSG